MKTGLLIYDDDPKADRAEKVRRAAARYQAKYGEAPTACYVHPSMLTEGELAVQGIDILAWRSILPNHLWLGIGEKAAPAPPPAAVEPPAPARRKPARRRRANV